MTSREQSGNGRSGNDRSGNDPTDDKQSDNEQSGNALTRDELQTEVRTEFGQLEIVVEDWMRSRTTSEAGWPRGATGRPPA